jgi:hypothetical protein
VGAGGAGEWRVHVPPQVSEPLLKLPTIRGSQIKIRHFSLYGMETAAYSSREAFAPSPRQ